MTEQQLLDFIVESNRIEGIHKTYGHEIEAYKFLLHLDALATDDLLRFLQAIQPNAVLRDRLGLNVRVGGHVPPKGGGEIRLELEKILAEVNRLHQQPGVGLREYGKEAYQMHHQYETLHPFTDGNGRSGRALWLWMMNATAPLGFLHTWYYQSLAYGRNV